MRRMDEQLRFIEALYVNFITNAKRHIKIEKESKSSYNDNYMNKNHGKVALKRKITVLRQELLNLEKMID